MAVCIGYFDASGSPDDPNKRTLCVAGYVATEKNWVAFEKAWEKTLAAEHLTTFHMKDFAHFKKDFANGWREDEGRRRKLIQDLTRVTQRAVRRAFSSSVDLNDYDRVNDVYEFRERAGSPYALLAGAVIVKVQRWMHRTYPKNQILFVFEKGDKDQGELGSISKELEGRLDHELMVLQKHSKVNGVTHYLRPFEACDLLAYEHGLVFPLPTTEKPVRGSLSLLAAKVRGADGGGTYNSVALLHICNDLRIPKRRRLVP